MNAFVRQLAVLGVLWPLCELLLPEGRQQKLVRMAVSLLVMVALIGGLQNLLSLAPHSLPVLTDAAVSSGAESYARTALQAAANNAEAFCVRLCERAGYSARAAVYLTAQGAVEHIDLWLKARNAAPLVAAQTLRSAVAQQLSLPVETVRLKQTEAP